MHQNYQNWFLACVKSLLPVKLFLILKIIILLLGCGPTYFSVWSELIIIHFYCFCRSLNKEQCLDIADEMCFWRKHRNTWVAHQEAGGTTSPSCTRKRTVSSVHPDGAEGTFESGSLWTATYELQHSKKSVAFYSFDVHFLQILECLWAVSAFVFIRPQRPTEEVSWWIRREIY